MKKYLVGAASVLAVATLVLAAIPAVAASVDINIGVPRVVVQPQPVYLLPRPVYVQPQYEHDWRERQLRAIEWRDNPKSHGQKVSAAAHDRNDARKSKHKKSNGKGKRGH